MSAYHDGYMHKTAADPTPNRIWVGSRPLRLPASTSQLQSQAITPGGMWMANFAATAGMQDLEDKAKKMLKHQYIMVEPGPNAPQHFKRYLKDIGNNRKAFFLSAMKTPGKKEGEYWLKPTINEPSDMAHALSYLKGGDAGGDIQRGSATYPTNEQLVDMMLRFNQMRRQKIPYPTMGLGLNSNAAVNTLLRDSGIQLTPMTSNIGSVGATSVIPNKPVIGEEDHAKATGPDLQTRANTIRTYADLRNKGQTHQQAQGLGRLGRVLKEDWEKTKHRWTNPFETFVVPQVKKWDAD